MRRFRWLLAVDDQHLTDVLHREGVGAGADLGQHDRPILPLGLYADFYEFMRADRPLDLCEYRACQAFVAHQDNRVECVCAGF